MSPVLRRWLGHLSIRRRLLAAAIKRHAPAALIAKRRGQVAQAERVVARHRVINSVSEAGTELIAGFEGGQGKDGMFHPYRDAVGVWTIGYGHTTGVSARSEALTKTQALALLHEDLNRVYAPPVAHLHLPLNQHQFDALVSFVYNLGPGVLASGTSIGRALRAREWKVAADAMLLYDRAGGRVLPGLLSRRQAERKLFLS